MDSLHPGHGACGLYPLYRFSRSRRAKTQDFEQGRRSVRDLSSAYQVSLPLNLDNPDVETKMDLVPHTAKKREVNVAMSNSFGFGGTNASLLLKRFEA